MQYFFTTLTREYYIQFQKSVWKKKNRAKIIKSLWFHSHIQRNQISRCSLFHYALLRPNNSEVHPAVVFEIQSTFCVHATAALALVDSSPSEAGLDWVLMRKLLYQTLLAIYTPALLLKVHSGGSAPCMMSDHPPLLIITKRVVFTLKGCRSLEVGWSPLVGESREEVTWWHVLVLGINRVVFTLDEDRSAGERWFAEKGWSLNGDWFLEGS